MEVKLDAIAPFKVGDEILVYDAGQWHRAEILGEDDGFEVRWKQDNKPWGKTVPYWDQKYMQPI